MQLKKTQDIDTLSACIGNLHAAGIVLNLSLSYNWIMKSSRVVSSAYLKDQDETDPLVVFHIFPLMGVGRGQHAWVGDVDANALPKGAGNRPS